MGIIAERFDSMRIEASSPDGQIHGTFHPDHGLAIAFRADSYSGYRERDLERQLSALLTRCWTGYESHRQAVFAEASGGPAVRIEPWRAEHRRFRADREQTRFEGMSPSGDVFAHNTGLRGWRFVIRDGALSALSEDEFSTEAAGAYAAMMRDYHLKVARLRGKHQLRR